MVWFVLDKQVLCWLNDELFIFLMKSPCLLVRFCFVASIVGGAW